jgi:plasmid stabilization system protein ParE
MAKYDVLLYPKAYRDIEEIYSYLANEKLKPGIARGQTDHIWDAISSLELYPDSHQERLTGRGYRQMIIDNYIAIFKIDEEQRKVFVVTVQYGARNI